MSNRSSVVLHFDSRKSKQRFAVAIVHNCVFTEFSFLFLLPCSAKVCSALWQQLRGWRQWEKEGKGTRQCLHTALPNNGITSSSLHIERICLQNMPTWDAFLKGRLKRDVHLKCASVRDELFDQSFAVPMDLTGFLPFFLCSFSFSAFNKRTIKHVVYHRW